MKREQARDRVVDALLDLTTDIAERILVGDEHQVINHPSLIVQLGERLEPGTSGDDIAVAGSGFGSRAPLNLEALDVLIHIDTESRRWVSYGLDKPTRSETSDNLRLLIGECASLADVDLLELSKDAPRWLTQARTATEWESPPWRPNVACPLCEHRGLRVRLSTKTGYCTKCGEAWSEETISLLADYVRLATDGEGDLSVAGS